MGIGGFENKLIASSKVQFMEKYKLAYSDDLRFAQSVLGKDMLIEYNDNGTARIKYGAMDFVAQVKGHIPNRREIAASVQPKQTEDDKMAEEVTSTGEAAQLNRPSPPPDYSIWDAGKEVKDKRVQGRFCR